MARAVLARRVGLSGSALSGQRPSVMPDGRLYVIDDSHDGEMLFERRDVYPNGIAFVSFSAGRPIDISAINR